MGVDFSWDRFEALPIVGILRGFEVDTVRLLVEAAARGGLGSVEVTMNSPSASEAIAAAARDLGVEIRTGCGVESILVGALG